MKKISIFLASSNELKQEREQMEIRISRKNKLWSGKGVELRPEIWEDTTARMATTRSQDRYNEIVKKSDLFVLLASTKVGIYTHEEFETAFGAFQATKKPFIFTYFKETEEPKDDSLQAFKAKLESLGHFYARYTDFNDLWNQFNKELDRLLLAEFKSNDFVKPPQTNVDNTEAKIEKQYINTTIENTTIVNTNSSIHKNLGTIPPKPAVFIGRDHSPDEIHTQLCNNQNLLLLVNGEGGIGKTTLAAQYYHKFDSFYNHLIWLVADKSITNAFISLAGNLEISFPDNSTEDEQLQLIISILKSLPKPVLIVLDNADRLNDLQSNYPLLRQLPYLHILITSRINNFEQIQRYPVDTLSEGYAIQLFKKYFTAFKEEETGLLKQVLHAIGYNTLVLELLAKNLHNFNDELEQAYTLQQLVTDLQQKGLLALSQTDTVHTDWKLQSATPEQMVLAMYDITHLEDIHQQLLSVFAVLPIEAIPYKYLKQFLPDTKNLSKNLKQLVQEGWCTYDKQNSSFKVNPVVATVIRTKNNSRISKDITPMLDRIVDRLDYQPGTGHIEGDFTETQQVVAYAENITRYPELIPYTHYVIYERLGNFFKTYGNLNKTLEYFKERLKLGKELHKSHPDNLNFKNGLAIAYSKLGETYTSLGDLDKVLQYHEEETKLFEELYKSHPDNVGFKNGLAIAYEKLGKTYTSLGDLDKALQYFEDFANLMDEICKSHPDNVGFKNGLAVAYSRLGETYTSLGKLDKALQYFEDYLKLGKELYDRHPDNVGFKNGLAIAHEKLGETYTSLGDMDKALQYFEDFANLMEEICKSHPNNVNFKNGLAIAYFKLGTLYTDKLNKRIEGIGFLNNAKVIFKEF